MTPRSNKKGKPKKLKKPTVKERGIGRPEPTLTEGVSILIVCEDSKSSPSYFEQFRDKLLGRVRLSDINVEVRGEGFGPDPKTVVEFAKAMRQKALIGSNSDGYDRIFCVIDIDDHPPARLGAASDMAKDNKIDLIISNPCFEYWYLLHYEKTGSAITDRKRLNQELTKHLYGKGSRRKYDKSGCKFFDDIYPRTETAIGNSKAILRSQHPNAKDLSKCNPSTHVHKVIECLQKLA